MYYPVAWTDMSTGNTYEKGYYDENGRRYENVSFQKNGKYENVVCHCPYCGQDSVMNLDADKISAQSLQCPHCGGPMEIGSQLDEYLDDANESAGFRGMGAPNTTNRKRRRWVTAIVVLLVLWLIGRFAPESEEPDVPASPYESAQQVYVADDGVSNVSLFGEAVALVRSGEDAYVMASEDQVADKRAEWDAGADSYYDADSDCWFWYNTDVEPAIWQYWYEGISSDFGYYGWMEHDETGWYIEASEGNWIPLPGGYDTDGLWYIAD